MKELFVVGCHRSGTTLMRRLLNSNKKTYLSKETRFIPDLYDKYSLLSPAEWKKGGAGDLIEQVNVYLRQELWSSLPTVKGFLASDHEKNYRGFIRYVWFLEAGQPSPALQYVGDNSPRYVLCIPTLQKLFPEAYYIHMVRDPRDVVASVLPLHFGGSDAASAAREWAEHIGAWSLAEKQLPPRSCMTIRYEDLTADPTSQLARVREFLSLDEELRDDLTFPNDDTEILANSRNHHRHLRDPIDTSRVGRFRKDLSLIQVAQVQELARHGMRRHGYDPVAVSPGAVCWAKQFNKGPLGILGRGMGAVRHRVSRFRHFIARQRGRRTT